MGIGSIDDERDWWWRDGGDPKIKVTCSNSTELRYFQDLEADSTKPGSLSTTINMLIKVYNEIPEEYRDQAYLQLSSYEYSDCAYGEVFYVRDMTEKETIEVEVVKKKYKHEEEEKEKREYERLQKKYGDDIDKLLGE